MTKAGSLGVRACYNGSRAPVAQLDRASGYEPEGRVFESLRAHHKNTDLLLTTKVRRIAFTDGHAEMAIKVR